MNYSYDFSSTAKPIPLLLKGDKFIWPKIDSVGDTVLIKLHVKDKWYNKFSLPYLKVETNGFSQEQYLERKNSGVRYFNLSELANVVKPGQCVKLSSNRLTWQLESAELLIFQNKIADNSKTLVIAPHPDDAELAAFGFYSTHDSHIVTIIAGEGGRSDYCKAYSENASEQRLFQAKIRTLDSITVPMQGGVAPDRAVNLSYFNNTLDQMHKEPMAPVKSLVTEVDDINQFRKLNFSSLLPVSNGKATWQNLLVDLRYLIEHIKPDTIILPHPWLDKHPDHRLSALAIFMALKDSSFKSGNFLFYVTHSTLSTKYPYGPRHSPITVPPNFIKDQLKYSVFSYPLSHEQQIEKLFALDSMHDISTIPGTIYDFKWLLHQLLTNKGHGNQPWLGYYRKAVRANELFLVVPFSETQKLINLTEAVIKQ